MVQAKLAQVPAFPDSLKTLVEHLIISHHGQYDFGSPKLPMFPEALLLHYLDDLDSKMEAMRAQFERGADSDGAWTGYNPSLGRPLLNTAKFLAQKDSEESEIDEEPDLTARAENPVSGETVATVSAAQVDNHDGLDPAEKPEPAEIPEKSSAAMTSVSHEDKI
jgi:3'-5' exoribonuclease